MSNVIPFTHPDKVREEIRKQACEHLARLDAGASEADIAQIGHWLNADSAHVDMLLEMAATWDEMSVLAELSEVFPLKQYGPPPAHSQQRRWLLATAATVLLAAAGLSGQRLFMDRSATASPVSYETKVGEQSTVTLADGSRIILNTNTLLEVTYTQAERNVVLVRGEGHFTVAKDASRPFRVHAANSVVEATGTAFAVQHSVESVEVTVTEGSVNFIRGVATPPADSSTDATSTSPAPLPADVAMALVAGEYAEINKQNPTIAVIRMQPAEIEVRLAWRHGMLLFQDEPLDKVLREVSRYTSITIEAADDILDLKVIGYYPVDNIEVFLEGMRENFPVEVKRISDEHIVLVAKQ